MTRPAGGAETARPWKCEATCRGTEKRRQLRLILHERFDRGGEKADIARANVYRVRDGQIGDVWIFEGSQYEVDEFVTKS